MTDPTTAIIESLRDEVRQLGVEVRERLRTQHAATTCLTIRQVSERVSIPVPTIRKMLADGTFPKPSVTIKRSHLWRLAKIEAWLDQNERKVRMGL
jgi:predicted DNA-binding transcriptional regulator AlpA